LTARPDGRVEYHFRRPDPSGRRSWVTDGTTWCRRLATLIPPRRSHTTRFHGVPAEALAERGIASARIDKRGMFASAGAEADPNHVTISDYAADAHMSVRSSASQ
jgi:hypothetical protein